MVPKRAPKPISRGGSFFTEFHPCLKSSGDMCSPSTYRVLPPRARAEGGERGCHSGAPRAWVRPPACARSAGATNSIGQLLAPTLKEEHLFVLNYIEVSVMLREAGWGFDLPLHTLDPLHLAVAAGSELPVAPQPI